MKTSLIRAAANVVNDGYVSRATLNTKRMPGTDWKTLKKNYYLIPLYGTMAFAMSLVVGFATRMMFRATDISWKKQPEPYNYYAEKQYKFMNIAGRDFKQDPAMKEAQKALRGN